MGQTAAETVKEIELTRERLGDELKQLEERMPSPARVARKVGGILAGGGITGAVVWFVVRRVRARAIPEPALAVPVQAVVKLLPDAVGERIEDALGDLDVRTLITGFGAAMIATRLLELRRLRALNRALLAAR